MIGRFALFHSQRPPAYLSLVNPTRFNQLSVAQGECIPMPRCIPHGFRTSKVRQSHTVLQCPSDPHKHWLIMCRHTEKSQNFSVQRARVSILTLTPTIIL
jgi:hypothetical protein